MQQRKSWKPLLALTGARPSPNLFAYFHHIGMLVLSLVVGLMAVLLILTEVLLFVKFLQHPPEFILLWLQQHALPIFEIVAFTFAASIFAYTDGKQTIKHMKGLVILTRANPEQPPPVTLSEYVEVSTPAWLQPLPPVDLPDEMLDTLQQHINPEEPWMKNLATYLKEYVPEHSPSISTLVSLGDRITISVLGSTGKRQHIPLTQEQTAALIGLLAVRERGAWVLRQHAIRPIYGEDDQNVTKHISRLNASLNKAAQKVVAQSGKPEGDQSSCIHEKLKLIEYDESGKENLWRLLITCDVEIFSELESLYAQIMAAKNDPNIPPPGRKILRRGCHRMVEQYRNGLFASYQRKHPNQYWSWATEYYTMYRDKCLFVLEYAAKREWAYAMKNKQKPDVLHASIRQTAQLYEWSLKVALGIIPNLPHAERAVYNCLKLYRMIDDLISGQTIFQTYATYMIKRNDARKTERNKTWQPPAEITNMWPEATSLPKSDSES